MLDSKAITKIQSIILIAIIIISVIGISSVYLLLNESSQSSETIKIGVLADLNGEIGKNTWQSVILASEQINNLGGILGKTVEIIEEDRGDGSDILTVSSGLTRLITYHKVDFIIAQTGGGELGFVCQDIIAEHKIIMFDVLGNTPDLTQRVLNDYDKYKYYFRYIENATSSLRGMTDCLSLLRENLGFNKIGYIGGDFGISKTILQGLDNFLVANNFDVVYRNFYPMGTFDFSSYFAAAEAAGVEVLAPIIVGEEGIPFIKEYYDRQSPIFIYGGWIGPITRPAGWESTDGKCDNVATAGQPITAGYPITSITLETRDAFKDRWDEDITSSGARAYDALRFVLYDSIQRSGTIETDSVIEALEQTSIKTSTARNWVFTTSHDVMIGENIHDPEADYQLVMVFQWQNGNLVPVYPKKMMEEAEATYTFPLWDGPWND